MDGRIRTSDGSHKIRHVGAQCEKSLWTVRAMKHQDGVREDSDEPGIEGIPKEAR